eukprot:12057088-Heterocapsa_arctica.AAC.1
MAGSVLRLQLLQGSAPICCHCKGPGDKFGGWAFMGPSHLAMQVCMLHWDAPDDAWQCKHLLHEGNPSGLI